MPLSTASRRALHKEMPIETNNNHRVKFAYQEVICRSLAGIAPWLELRNVPSNETKLQYDFRQLAKLSISSLVDPSSPDYYPFNGSTGKQPLVEAAFLAHALIRAPENLLDELDDQTTKNLRLAFLSTRSIEPWKNNWMLFAAMVEVALKKMGEDINQSRIDNAISAHESWYLGDGIYGDGPRLNNNYYNSYVIYPMLIDILNAITAEDSKWIRTRLLTMRRAKRYVSIQERLIAPDGTFPPIGRSISYRCAAFQHLAQAALQGWLPYDLLPMQIRCCLGSVIERTLGALGTYGKDGWLQIGLAGHQPSLGEDYITTGSLYLASTIFLPLGLKSEDLFWSGVDFPWTSRRLWLNGEDALPDSSIKS